MSSKKLKIRRERQKAFAYFLRKRRLIKKTYPKRVLDIEEVSTINYLGNLVDDGYLVTFKKPYASCGNKQVQTYTMKDVEWFVKNAERIPEEEWDALPLRDENEEDDFVWWG